MTTLVTIVLPTHNRPALLREAIASVLKQTYRPIELVVTDDASVPPIQLPPVDDPGATVRFVHHGMALGGAASKADGAAAATGAIVCFLDDDDLFAPTYIARAVEALAQNPDIDVLFMNVDWFGAAAEWNVRAHGDSMARVLAEADPQARGGGVVVFGDALLPALLRRVPMPFQRPVVRREALVRIGSYRADCLLWDCDWALRAALHARCGLLMDRLYRQRADGQGYSSRGSREREHIESACEMTLRLYGDSAASVRDTVRRQLREGAALNAARLAYHHAQHGRLRPALRAWMKAFRLDRRFANWKLPLSATARAAGLLKRAGSEG